jgi:putative transposase
VILDIYSRYAPGWLVAPGESAELGLYTPASVSCGTAPQIRAHRAIVLDQAMRPTPQRFARPPTPPRLPAVAWINQPTPEALIQTR